MPKQQHTRISATSTNIKQRNQSGIFGDFKNTVHTVHTLMNERYAFMAQRWSHGWSRFNNGYRNLLGDHFGWCNRDDVQSETDSIASSVHVALFDAFFALENFKYF